MQASKRRKTSSSSSSTQSAGKYFGLRPEPTAAAGWKCARSNSLSSSSSSGSYSSNRSHEDCDDGDDGLPCESIFAVPPPSPLCWSSASSPSSSCSTVSPPSQCSPPPPERMAGTLMCSVRLVKFLSATSSARMMAPPLHEHVVRSKHARQTEASCIAAASVHEGRLTVVKDAPRAALRIRVHRAPPGTKPRPPCGALADCPDGSGLVLSTWLSVLCSRSPNCRKLVTVIYSPTAESRHISMQKADQAKRYVAEGVRMGAGFCPESAGLTWRRGAVEAIVASGGRLLVRGYAASPDSDVADALAGPVEGGHASDPPPKDPLAFRCVYDSGCAHVAMSRRACFMIDEVAGRVCGWGQEFRTRALPDVIAQTAMATVSANEWVAVFVASADRSVIVLDLETWAVFSTADDVTLDSFGACTGMRAALPVRRGAMLHKASGGVVYASVAAGLPWLLAVDMNITSNVVCWDSGENTLYYERLM